MLHQSFFIFYFEIKYVNSLENNKLFRKPTIKLGILFHHKYRQRKQQNRLKIKKITKNENNHIVIK